MGSWARSPVGLGRGPRTYISDKPPGDAAVGLGTTRGKPPPGTTLRPSLPRPWRSPPDPAAYHLVVLIRLPAFPHSHI